MFYLKSMDMGLQHGILFLCQITTKNNQSKGLIPQKALLIKKIIFRLLKCPLRQENSGPSKSIHIK